MMSRPAAKNDQQKRSKLLDISEKLARRRKGFRIPYIQERENNTDNDSIIAGLSDRPLSRVGSPDNTSKASVRVTFAAAGARSAVISQLKSTSSNVGESTLPLAPGISGKSLGLSTKGMSMKLDDKVVDKSHRSLEDVEYEEYLDTLHVSSFGVATSDDEEAVMEGETKLDHDFLFHADELLHMVLELPAGFHPKPSEGDHHHKTPLQVSLLGLPGGLNLTPAVTNKYFGACARREFFERFHWLSHQTNLIGAMGISRQKLSEESDSQADDESASIVSQEYQNPAFPHHIDIEPGEELILDHQPELDECIPFAPRRPKLGPEAERELHYLRASMPSLHMSTVSFGINDLENQETSLSNIRHNARQALLTNQTSKIPTLEDILGAESSVVAKLAEEKAKVQEEIEKMAKAEEASRKRFAFLNNRTQSKTSASRPRSAKVEVPILPIPQTASIDTKPEVILPTNSSLLKRPLTAKTVNTIVSFQNPAVLNELTKSRDQRLIAMHSDLDVSEDRSKLDARSNSARRREQEEKERIRLAQVKENLRMLIMKWKTQAEQQKIDAEKELEKTKVARTMLHESEKGLRTLIKSGQQVDIKPVKFMSKGKSQVDSQQLSGKENVGNIVCETRSASPGPSQQQSQKSLRPSSAQTAGVAVKGSSEKFAKPKVPSLTFDTSLDNPKSKEHAPHHKPGEDHDTKSKGDAPHGHTTHRSYHHTHHHHHHHHHDHPHHQHNYSHSPAHHDHHRKQSASPGGLTDRDVVPLSLHVGPGTNGQNHRSRSVSVLHVDPRFGEGSLTSGPSKLFSLNGLLVGPGGILDESRFGFHSQSQTSAGIAFQQQNHVHDDCSSVEVGDQWTQQSPMEFSMTDESFPFRRSCASSLCGDDSVGNNTFGMDTVILETKLRGVAQSTEQGSTIPFQPPSPRTLYIEGCMREKVNPRASLVLRRSLTKKLDLQHQGMGDEMAQVLAESLRTLPFIQGINLTDNRLTDDGLGPLMKAALDIPGLLELNLSQNEIGPVSAEALFDYLKWKQCPLQKLVMANADVDDGEAAHFIEAIKENRSLKELILSNNKIGEAENYNTVFPDYQTGGEAIAELLCKDSCQIKILRLDWNKIRLGSGVEIANSLMVNRVLTYLDLSYNTLGHDGGIALGKSLETNKALKTLAITNNGIDAAGCICICAGIIENYCIKHVFIDGNPIGQQGAKALMMVPMAVGSRISISGTRCNIALKDSACEFDFVNILASYELNMEDPYQRAVFMMLIHLTSNHHSYHFSDVEHHMPLRNHSAPSANRNAADVRIKRMELIQSFSNERVQYFDDSQHRVWNALKNVQKASSDFQQAITLFRQVDQDGSGHVDKDELSTLMKNLGLEMNEKRLDDVMRTYDVSGGGSIELHEFLAFLKAQYYEADDRIKDLTQIPIIAVRNTPSIRFVPPTRGIMKFRIVDDFVRKRLFRIMTACDTAYIKMMALGAGADSIQMIGNGIQTSLMRLDEGLSMFDVMLKETSHKIKILCKILPQMVDPVDAKQLVAACLSHKAEILQLKRAMGSALRPILGEPNGYYCLDLSDEMDRLCVTRLMEVSNTTARNKKEKSKIGYGLVGDLSLHGNWSCFRNELFNGAQFILTLSFANPLPKTGKLEFDFSSGSRPSPGCPSVTDERVVQVLLNHCMLSQDKQQLALNRLRVHKKMGEIALDCVGHTMYAQTQARATKVALCQDEFYSRIRERMHSYHTQLEIEKSGVEVGSSGPQVLAGYCDDEGDSEAYNMLGYDNFNDESTATPTIEDDDGSCAQSLDGAIFSEALQNIADMNSDYEPFAEIPWEESVAESERVSQTENSAGVSRTRRVALLDLDGDTMAIPMTSSVEAHHQKSSSTVLPGVGLSRSDSNILNTSYVMGADTDNFMAKFKKLLESRSASIGMKAMRIIEVLQDVFSRSFLLARHITLIIDCFRPFGEKASAAGFGTYNVELIIQFFDKIIDLHNVDVILTRLSAFEVACLFCRLGILSIFNPGKPEGGWELNMSRWDERMVAKQLCVLATVEPGDNWIGEEFRHSRYMEPVPGWELVSMWLTDQGMPKKGILSLVYYSGECQNKAGCKPNVNVRKSLYNLVLIEEAEVVEEGLRGRENPLVGDKAIRALLPVWATYLAVEKEDEKTLADNFQKLLKFNEFAVEQGKASKKIKKSKKAKKKNENNERPTSEKV